MRASATRCSLLLLASSVARCCCCFVLALLFAALALWCRSLLLPLSDSPRCAMATKPSQTKKCTTLNLSGFFVVARHLQDASFVNDLLRSGQQQLCQHCTLHITHAVRRTQRASTHTAAATSTYILAPQNRPFAHRLAASYINRNTQHDRDTGNHASHTDREQQERGPQPRGKRNGTNKRARRTHR